MADIYKFRVKLGECEKYIWRDIEIASVSTVLDLCSAAYHFFEIE